MRGGARARRAFRRCHVDGAFEFMTTAGTRHESRWPERGLFPIAVGIGDTEPCVEDLDVVVGLRRPYTRPVFPHGFGVEQRDRGRPLDDAPGGVPDVGSTGSETEAPFGNFVVTLVALLFGDCIGDAGDARIDGRVSGGGNDDTISDSGGPLEPLAVGQLCAPSCMGAGERAVEPAESSETDRFTQAVVRLAV